MDPANMIGRIILAILCLQSVASYSTFLTKIPNGENVPFPCKPGEKWKGVGHYLDEGTGARNRFGADFYAAGKTWTVELCKKDSDGDGMTNGQELGDPDCVWKENTTPKTNISISHPGICDPWNSPKCEETKLNGTYETQKQWMAKECKLDGLDCPAMNETDVKQIVLQLPTGTKVPPKETTYECQIFDLRANGLPPNQDFHMVAVTPIINNTNILHHMVLFNCSDDTNVTADPFECGMLASQKCQEFLHVWTVGLDGECYHPLSGIRLGRSGTKIVAIQLHWNNPGKRADYTDSSGLRLYYTPHLRQYDAGVMMIGSIHFTLAPKKPDITVVGTCSSSCTNTIINGAVNVTSAWNHMHYAGYKMDVQVLRNNTFLQYLTNDKVYSYDSPQVQLYPDPFELKQGDALITNCGFQTLNRNKTTFYGEGTSDEMCFAFLTYYPKENITNPFCVDEMGLSYCDPKSLQGCANFSAFESAISTTDAFLEVSNACHPFSPCLEECQDTIIKFMKTEKCMQGNVWDYLQDALAQKSDGELFLSLLYSCKVEVYLAMNPTKAPATTQIPPTQTKQQYETTTGKAAKTTAIDSILFVAVTMVTALLWRE